jgi:hypothetical protein
VISPSCALDPRVDGQNSTTARNHATRAFSAQLLPIARHEITADIGHSPEFRDRSQVKLASTA